MRERHTIWATYIKIIKACLHETYQDTIKITPHEAQFNTKPTRDWERYIDPIVINTDRVELSRLQLRIKEKGERQAARINKLNKITEFEVGDNVLIRAHKLSDATKHIIAKFCALYEGPNVISRKVGSATYQLRDGMNSAVIRGVFNIIQIKKYHPEHLVDA